MMDSNRGQHPQDVAHALSLRDPELFWSHQAARLSWHNPPRRALTQSTKTIRIPTSSSSKEISQPTWTWFPGGQINTCYNCVDRHVLAGRGDAEAIIWDSPVTGKVERWTYNRVLEEVEVLAGVLREEGLGKGDTVVVYSMI